MEITQAQQAFVNGLKSKKDRELVNEVLGKNNIEEVFGYIKKMFNDGKDENEKVAGYTGMFRRTRRRRMLKILNSAKDPAGIISMLGNYFSSNRTHFTRYYERNRLRKFLTVCESLMKIGFDPGILVNPINDSPKQKARGPLLFTDHMRLATNETFNQFKSDQVVKRLYRARKSEKKLIRYANALRHYNENHRAKEFFDAVDKFSGSINEIAEGNFLDTSVQIRARRGTMAAPKQLPPGGQSNQKGLGTLSSVLNADATSGRKSRAGGGVGFQLPTMGGEIPGVSTEQHLDKDP